MVRPLRTQKEITPKMSLTAARYVGYVGAAANWLIPTAAINNLRNKPASEIDVRMTSILSLYSLVFVRWAIAISPPNYLLCACHLTNSSAQLVTLGKYYFYASSQPSTLSK